MADLMDRAVEAEHRGQFEAARGLLRQLMQAAEGALRLDAALRLGKLCISGGAALYGEAESILHSARHQARERPSARREAVAVHLLALLYYRQRRLEDAWQLLDQSPILPATAPASAEAAQWFHYRGLLTAARGDPVNAERLYFRAYQMYREIGHDAGLAEICDSLANLLLQRGKTRPALRFAELSLHLKRRLGDRYGEAISLGTRGRIELRLARPEQARHSFAEDLAIAQEVGDEAGVGIMLNSLGETALVQKDVAAAEEYFGSNAASDRGALNRFFAEVGLIRVYLASGRLDDARAACRRLEELLAQRPELHQGSDIVSGLHGALAWRAGDFAAGERGLYQAIEGLRRRHHVLDTIPFLYELRDLYQRQGMLDRAVAVMADALDLWSECGAERGVRDVEDWLRTVDRPALVRLALERHLPASLVQDVLNGKLVPHEPRLQHLTVLFSDLRDYTSLSEQTSPAELIELLNEWFSEATRVIHRHGGLVDKFMGDAIMALFGVPDERADAAADAVRAALDLRDTLSAFNLRQQALGQPQLRIGIGIDSGVAVVGFIGSHLRQSFTAIGDVVNTASRLESATKEHGCDVLISRATQEMQERYGVAETAFLGNIRVKGRRSEVAAYKVLSLSGRSASLG